MAASIVGSATKAGAASNSATLSVTTNSSVAVGDLIVCAFEMRGSTNNRAVGPDSSWTEAFALANTTGGAMNVLSRVATAAGAQSFTFTFKGTGADPTAVTSVISSALCYVARGQKSTSPLSSLASGTGTTQAITLPSVTTTEDAEPVLRFVGGQPPTGSTDEKTPTWDAAVGNVATSQGTGGTGTGFTFITGSTETGPTPAAAIGTRSLTLQNAPSTWSRVSLGVLAAPTGTPSATVAPAVTGTAAVGSVLTTDNGTWDQTGLSFAYQWQTNASGSYVNISGATSATYTVASGDAGHSVRCVVSATNTNGTGTANSNATAIPAAPVNTVAPAISPAGPYATGQTVTVDNGTWTGTGITYTYQWFRGASPITGQTSASYLLVVSDEGASVSAQVTATNGGGSVTATSNTITPTISAPLSDDSFLTYYSGGTSNTDPALSIGSGRGGTVSTSLNGLFGPLLGSVAQAGGTFYRVIYVRNTHATATAASCKLFLEQQFTTPGLALAVAVPSQGVNTVVPALASQTTAPSGVTWTTATDPASGLAFGNLGPTQWRGVYVRLTVTPGTAQTPEADATIAVEGSAA